MGGKIRQYDPQTKDINAVKRYMTALPLTELDPDASFDVVIHFYVPIPVSKTRREKNLISWGIEVPTCKPDVDNLAKFYLDCANGIFFVDDRQIISLNLKKSYSTEPRTEVDIMPSKTTIEKSVKGILEEISPREMLTLVGDLNELDDAVMAAEQIDGEKDSSGYMEQIGKVASFISRFADRYAKALMTINKKYPHFWENHAS
jgi:Holliday junction resolvase RusA-like endonuclease